MTEPLASLLDGATLDHVAMVVRDRDRAVEFYRTLVAGPFLKLDYSNTALVYGQRCSYSLRMALAPLSDKVDIEIIELAGGSHPIHERFLAERGEGLQHIAYQVEDLDAATEDFRRAGYPPILQKDGPDPVSVYLDTTAVGGTITELIRKGFKLASLAAPAEES